NATTPNRCGRSEKAGRLRLKSLQCWNVRDAGRDAAFGNYVRDMAANIVTVLCGRAATIAGHIGIKAVELLDRGAHYAHGMLGMALASMHPSRVATRNGVRRARSLVAASLCAAALFATTAWAQDAGENTAVDVVASRLNDSLSREMFATFNLFI